MQIGVGSGGYWQPKSVLERRGMCGGGQNQVFRQQAEQEQIVERFGAQDPGQDELLGSQGPLVAERIIALEERREAL
jgi:hypothetical protein